MNASDLDYPLPEERIAQVPLPERDQARLLVVRQTGGPFEHRLIRDLPLLLAPADLLVRNVSRVVPARLFGRRTTGGRVELLLVRALGPDRYLALARPAARLGDGERLRLDSGFEVTVERAAGEEPGFVIARAEGLEEESARSGVPPLPPYIRRPAEVADRARYQTVYAREPGSVAAPTAGLHFSTTLLGALEARGIGTADVTLHIGPGTFAPLRETHLERHRMHEERFAVPAETVRAVAATREAKGRVVAVGTSSLRALETAASGGVLEACSGETRLFVVPGFRFRVTDALLTNFHQPRSTLLALVAALAGLERTKAAYTEALASGYRFLSYGDAMLIV